MGAALLSEKEYRFFSMEFQDEQIALRLSKRDEAAFEQVFKTHYKDLHAYAFTMLKDEDGAEEMVQKIFFKLWERSEHLSFSGPIAAYLYRAVHNESLNFIKHQKVKRVTSCMWRQYEKQIGTGTTKNDRKELENKFRSAE